MHKWALCFLLLPALAHAETNLGFGAAITVRAHSSPNTILLSPGPEVFVSLLFNRSLEIRPYLHAGSFFGDDLSCGIDAYYRLRLGFWQPGLGAGISLIYASPIFSTTSSAYYLPLNPGCGALLAIDPLCFRTNDMACSFLEIHVGPDLVNIWKVYLLDLVVFRLTVYL
jgi:hypothetical protein